MMLLKVIMREGNVVLCISIILSFPSLCWKSWSCTCFAFICLVLCASLIYFLTRFLCIGSGLDLNVFHICFLMLSFASIHIFMWASSQLSAQKTRSNQVFSAPSWKALKKSTSWEITHALFSVAFLFCWVLEVVTSVTNAPYPFCLVFVPRIASNGRRYNFWGVVVPRQIPCCYQKKSYAQPERQKITTFNEHMPLVLSNFH